MDIEPKKPTHFIIKNWEKYQHRDHKKNQPWVKWNQDILDDPKMFELSTYQVGVFSKLILLCAKSGPYLSMSQTYLRSRLNLTKSVDLALFQRLGLIELVCPESHRAETARFLKPEKPGGIQYVVEKDGVLVSVKAINEHIKNGTYSAFVKKVFKDLERCANGRRQS